MYQPPEEMLATLGKIAELVTNATIVDKERFGKHGATFIGTLPGGELYFEVPTIDVDDDGDSEGSPAHWVSHPVRAGKIDTFRQEQTSYGGQLPIKADHTDGISPFEVPYIVLPGGKSKPFWFAQRGIALGDGAMIIRGDKCVEAVFVQGCCSDWHHPANPVAPAGNNVRRHPESANRVRRTRDIGLYPLHPDSHYRS